MTRFPRVLVATSNNFNQVTGGGVTLSNLFRGWPSHCLANLHEDPSPEDTTVCPRSYRLTPREVRWAWPLSIVEPSRGAADRGGALALPAQAAGAPRVFRRWLGDGIPRTVRISRELQAWLDDFQPDVIYAFLGSVAQVLLVERLVERLRVPLVIHTMDDWPAVIYRRSIFAPVVRPLLLRRWRGLLSRATARLAISSQMAREYESRYGYAFIPFHNALDMEEWRRRARTTWAAAGEFVVRYVGSVLVNAQASAMEDVCGAVARLRAQDRRVRIEIHTPSAIVRGWPERFGDGVRVFPPPDDAAIVGLLSGADLLVLPFNFDRDSREYIRLSMPTKVPAYMAAGTPVLLYGPRDVAPIQYAASDGWGRTVTHRRIDALADAIAGLMRDGAAREALGRRAMALAYARHDAGIVRQAFWAVLAQAAAAGGWR